MAPARPSHDSDEMKAASSEEGSDMEAAYHDYLDACVERGEEPQSFADFCAYAKDIARRSTTLPASSIVDDEDDDIPF